MFLCQGGKVRYSIFLILFLVGCKEKEAQYIPGPNFFQKLEVSLSDSNIYLADEIIITVARETGGWIKASDSEVREGQCKFISQPPQLQKDISLNTAYTIKPDGSQVFGISPDGERTLRFNKPGTYQLIAHSSLWCAPGITTQPITITVSQ